jgi:hypothetical protein
MSIHFTQYVIGMHTDVVSNTGVHAVTYLWFAEQRAAAYPAQVLNPSEAKFLGSEDQAKNYIKVFEIMDERYKNKLFVIPVKCQAVLANTYSESLKANISSQKKVALKV